MPFHIKATEFHDSLLHQLIKTFSSMRFIKNNLKVAPNSTDEYFKNSANSAFVGDNTAREHPHSPAHLDSQIESELNAYVSHSLSSLKNASLMRRVDSKFLVPVSLVPSLLRELRQDYTILELDGLRSFNYVTTYYDTKQHTHYLDHHNGRLNRFKVRKRTYTDSDISFLEVKFKDNKNCTTKTRIASDEQIDNLDDESVNFLSELQVADPTKLQAVQTGTYQRVALANEIIGERLTIDFNLAFKDEINNSRFLLGPWVVVELKQHRLNRNSAFFAWAKKNAVRKTSFSKYCMGVYFTGSPSLKRNNFHKIARPINQ